MTRLRLPLLDGTAATRHALLGLAAVGIFFLSATVGLGITFGSRALDGPEGYLLVSTIDLSQKETFAENVYEFQLDKSASVNPTHLALKPGRYQVLFTFRKISGMVRLYTKIE